MSTMTASNLAEAVAELEIGDAPDTPGDTVPEYACEVCGVELTYSGRGRKPRFCDEHKKTAPKSGSTGRRSSKDVEAAVSALNQAYTLLQMGLMLAGAPKANVAMSASLPNLEKSNREHLANDPELARRIASLGKTGGRYAFFASQLLTIGPVLFLAFTELSENRKDRSEAAMFQDENLPATMGGFPVE